MSSLKNLVSMLCISAALVGMLYYPSILKAGAFQRYVYYQCGTPYYSYRAAGGSNGYGVNGAATTANSYDYSQTYNYSYYYNSNEYPAEQGSTVWGMHSVGDTYEQSNVGAALYAAQRFNETALEVAKEGHAAAVKLAEKNYRLAELKARRDIIIAALQGLSDTGNVNVYNQQTINKSGANGQPGVNDQASNNSWNKLLSLVQTKCVDCHSPTTPKGGLDMSNLEALTDGQVSSVMQRIKSTNPGSLMPKGGPPLTEEEISLFEMHLSK